MSGKTGEAPAADAPGAEGVEEPAPKRKRPLVKIAVAVALLAGVGAGGWFTAPRLLGWPAPAKSEARPEPPVKVTVPLPSLVVNVGPPETRRYLKIGVELGVPGAKEAKEVEERKPQLTDMLITVLAAMPVEKLGGAEGRSELKRELLERVKHELKLEKVSRVFVTEFVIQ